MTDLAGTIRAQINLAFDAEDDLGEHIATILSTGNEFNWTVTNGTGANQADLVYEAQRTLGATTSENLDLTGGTLLSPFGVALVFAKVKMIYLKAASANVGNIIMGGAAANPFVGPFVDVSDKLKFAGGQMNQFAAPDATAWAVGTDSADILKIENDGGTAGVYDIIIIGTSA